MVKKNILAILTGGTIAQIQNKEGKLSPKKIRYLEKIPSLSKNINITSFYVENPIDSTKMNTLDRKKIAKKIFEEYNSYDGFVVIQGTDTMAESATAINYMIQNQGKPIIFTGSQLPLLKTENEFYPGTDAINNLYFAFDAATKEIGETAIAFGKYLLRANRTIKISERDFDAFLSPNTPPLGINTLTGISLSENFIPKQKTNPEYFDQFDTRTIIFNQTSGTSFNSLEKIINEENLKGVVIEGFGAGNIDPKYLPAIKRAKELYKPIVVTTSCQKGFADIDTYDVNSEFTKEKIISAYDMTSIAASQKLMYALGLIKKEKINNKDKLDFIKYIIQKPINQDITI